MNNSKLTFVVVLILTFIVGGMLGYLISDAGQKPYGGHKLGSMQQMKEMCGKDMHQMPARHDMDKGRMMHKDGPMDSHRMMDKERDRDRGHMFVSIMDKKCNLTDEQEKNIVAILDSKKEDIESIREDIKDKMCAIKEETDEEISAVLTPEQLEQYEEMKEHAREKCGDFSRMMMQKKMMQSKKSRMCF